MVAEWIFDGVPPSGARHGGLAQAEVFDKSVDTFVREVLQNARDQKLPATDAVMVRFRIEDLEGPALVSFLEGIRWPELRPHLEAVASAGYVTISPRVIEALEILQGEGRMRVLRIDDAGTNGLTGAEDEVDSNFNALCRHTLITGAGRRESGGSFGLGKSVLWRFSGASTVLFSSRPVDADGAERFFGRTLLAWHSTAEGDWEGSGWLGNPEDRPGGGRRAVSVWGPEAAVLANDARIGRPFAENGTSILILAFDDPARETERELPDLCEEIAESAARWFWPAIESGRMRVRVEGVNQGGEVFARDVRTTEEIRPFVEAQAAAAVIVERVQDPGQIAERSIAIQVPALSASSSRAAKAAIQALAKVRLRLAESGEDKLANTVALERGTGMVVSYWIPPRILSDQAFHATLVGGTAHGTEPADHAAEEFLRAAEPVAHTEWTGTTDRVRSEYASGAATALRSLHEQLSQAVREMLQEAPVDATEGPEALRRLFPLPSTGGGTVALEPYRLSAATAYLSGDSWIFGGTFSRSGRADSRWRVRVALLLEQEAGGRGDALPIVLLSSDAGSVTGPKDGGGWEILVDPGIARLRFDGRAAPIDGMPPGVLSRTKVRLDVRTLMGSES